MGEEISDGPGPMLCPACYGKKEVVSWPLTLCRFFWHRSWVRARTYSDCRKCGGLGVIDPLGHPIDTRIADALLSHRAP